MISKKFVSFMYRLIETNKTPESLRKNGENMTCEKCFLSAQKFDIPPAFL